MALKILAILLNSMATKQIKEAHVGPRFFRDVATCDASKHWDKTKGKKSSVDRTQNITSPQV